MPVLLRVEVRLLAAADLVRATRTRRSPSCEPARTNAHSQSGVFCSKGRPPVDDAPHSDEMGRHRKRREPLTPSRFLVVVALGLGGYLAALTEAGVIRWTG